MRRKRGKILRVENIFNRHGQIPPQSGPTARLDIHTQIYRVRSPAHHGYGARKPVGRGADTLRTHERTGGKRLRRTLQVQTCRRSLRQLHGRMDSQSTRYPGTSRGKCRRPGQRIQTQSSGGRNIRFHPERRPAQPTQRRYCTRFRICHTQRHRQQMPGG